jgi:hypothetical protein
MSVTPSAGKWKSFIGWPVVVVYFGSLLTVVGGLLGASNEPLGNWRYVVIGGGVLFVLLSLVGLPLVLYREERDLFRGQRRSREKEPRAETPDARHRRQRD